MIQKICGIILYLFFAIGLFIAFGVVVVGVCHAQEISLYDEKDYGICKVLGGQIIYWQDGDTIRAKSVNADRSKRETLSGYNEDSIHARRYGNWEGDYWESYPRNSPTPLELAERSEAKGDFFQAALEYGDAGLLDKKFEMYAKDAERDELKGQYRSAGYGYERANMFDKALEMYDNAIKKAKKEKNYRKMQALMEDVEDCKKAKKLYEKREKP